MAAAQHRSTVRRFASKEIEPERSVGLLPGHPALSEGRTIFPSTVVASKDSPRFLVSGHNNPKLGKAVLKGPRTGWPIYQLSLEERATCPRSCAVWSECYGNAMPYARRHTPDADFLRFLIAEVTTACRAHPEGLLIRLHTLGDFYSVEYVYVWASLLNQFPQLHVFGYTARRVGDEDPETNRIARAIEVLTESAWERFAIRTSGARSLARSRSVVVDADPQEPGVIVCPAQTSDTEACASCGLCWASAARDKTIAFLKHGMKSSKGPRGPRAPKAANDETDLAPAPRQTEAAPALKVVASESQAPASRRVDQLQAFLSAEWKRQGKRADETIVSTYKEMHLGSGVPLGSVAFAVYELEKKGMLSYSKGKGGGKTTFRLIGISRPAAVHAADAAAATEPAVAVPAVVAAAPTVPSPIKITTKVSRPASAPSADDLPAQVRPDALPKGLSARKPGQCAYPTNSPPVGRGDETTFCCAPVAGKLQYCEAHARAMWPGRKAR